MFNIAICDDDIQAVGEMELLVQNIAQSHLVDVEIEVFCDGRGLADAVKGGNAFDIILILRWRKRVAFQPLRGFASMIRTY